MAQQEMVSGFRDVSERIMAFLPALLGAAALVLAGWLLGRLLAWVARRLVNAALAGLARRPSLSGAIEASGARRQIPAVIGGFVFWVVLVFFVAAALEAIGLPVVTAALSRAAYFLPNVLAALVVVFVGLILGKLVGSGVTRSVTGTGMAFGPAVGATVRGTVVFVAIVVAVEQVGIQADLLIVIVAVIVGSALAGAGLAFGLGARAAVSSIIASHYVGQAYKVGQTIRVGAIEGKIIETTPTAVFVAAPDGRVMIPADHFSQVTSVLLTER